MGVIKNMWVFSTCLQYQLFLSNPHVWSPVHTLVIVIEIKSVPQPHVPQKSPFEFMTRSFSEPLLYLPRKYSSVMVLNYWILFPSYLLSFYFNFQMLTLLDRSVPIQWCWFKSVAMFSFQPKSWIPSTLATSGQRLATCRHNPQKIMSLHVRVLTLPEFRVKVCFNSRRAPACTKDFHVAQFPLRISCSSHHSPIIV